jgi:hypothetical protein
MVRGQDVQRMGMKYLARGSGLDLGLTAEGKTFENKKGQGMRFELGASSHEAMLTSKSMQTLRSCMKARTVHLHRVRIRSFRETESVDSVNPINDNSLMF